MTHSAFYPGNPHVPNDSLYKPLQFADVAADGTLLGVDYNSFAILGSSYYDLHGELNAWHVETTGCMPGWWPLCFNPFPKGKHNLGRGQAPTGWYNIPFGKDEKVWWPFPVLTPDGGTRRLHAGDYVLMRGALWQDGDHEDDEKDPISQWGFGNTRGHTGWTEIHPVDWIVRLNDSGPPVWKSTMRIVGMSNLDVAIYPTHQSAYKDHQALPNFHVDGLPSRVFDAYHVEQLIDGRITQMSTVVTPVVIENKNDHVEVHAKVGGANILGRFKASYIVTWREIDSNDFVWVDDNVPDGATEVGINEGWNWVTEPTKYKKPFMGTRSHLSNGAIGIRQHSFQGATQQLLANSEDTLVAYVYLDPLDIPYEVMLQWNDGSWEHRAYWGANLIPWGQDGTVSRRYMGPIKVVGEWMRLEVPARTVGLEGQSLNGMAFTLFGGSAVWDRAGKCNKCGAIPVSEPIEPEPTEIPDGIPIKCKQKPYLPECRP